MNFWNNRVNIYDKLCLIAQDILAAPASQAYVERGFSVCGLLTAGRRNRMSNSLLFDRFLLRIAVKCQLKLRTKILYKKIKNYIKLKQNLLTKTKLILNQISINYINTTTKT